MRLCAVRNLSHAVIGDVASIIDQEVAARGARVIAAVDKEHSLHAVGGEARFLSRADVGADGCFVG